MPATRIRKFIIAIVGVLIIGGGFLIYSYYYKILFFTPKYAKEYTILALSCSYQEKICAQINFDFVPLGKAKNKIPAYSIQEFPDQAKTEVIFYNVNSVKA